MRISTGSEVLDKLLDGGYESDIITTIYGPAGSGKTLLCLLAAAVVAGSGKKVIFIDSEGGFSVERLAQLCENHKKVLSNILFLSPTNFEEQKAVFEKLKSVINEKIALVVVDTISMLYRLQLKRDEDVQDINRELGRQIGWLGELSRKKGIPVLITNQVYSNFDEREKICMVGGDILRYGSKCLIELQIMPNGRRKAILRKHRSIPERETFFKIVQTGIEEGKEKVGGFRLF